MPNTWRTLFLAQARSDYALFNKMRPDEAVELCHKLHFLQMATEKLAKGFATSPGRSVARTHKAFVRFVQTARTNPQLLRTNRYADRAQYRAYVESLLPLAQRIEALSSDGPDHANPEYPWEQQNGVLVSPLDYGWEGLQLQSPAMIRLLQFLDDCFLLA